MSSIFIDTAWVSSAGQFGADLTLGSGGDNIADFRKSADEKVVGTGNIIYPSDYHMINGKLKTTTFIDMDGSKFYVPVCYDVKSPSKNPYNYDNYNDLGLNQFFVGQSAYDYYNGDLKDSLYHDFAEIRLKGKKVYSGDGLKWTEKFANEFALTGTYKVNDDFIIKGFYFTGLDIFFSLENMNIGHLKMLDNDGKCDILEYPTFHCSGDDYPSPRNLRRFIDEWNNFYEIYLYDNASWYSGLIPLAVFALGVVAVATTGGAAFNAVSALSSAATLTAAEVITAVGAIGAFVSAAGLAITGFGMGIGNSSLMKIGKIVGIVGAIATLGASIANLTKTIANAVGESARSGISAAGNATQNGLNQTAGTYLKTGAMNASGSGSSSGLASGASEISKSSLEVGVDIFKQSASVIEKSISVYSSVSELFKNPNDFSDDEIPADSDKSEEREAFYRYDNRLRIRSKYAAEDNTDLGLMEGSLGYLKKQGFDEPKYPWQNEEIKTRVLPLVKQIDYFKNIHKKAKKKK